MLTMRRNRPARDRGSRGITLREFRDATRELSDDTPLVVGVRDRHHFDRLLGDLTVAGVTVEHGTPIPAVVLDVEGLS